MTLCHDRSRSRADHVHLPSLRGLTALFRRNWVVELGVLALLFAASTAVTIVWCNSMSAMREMPMPGGWTMSMAWMRMPGQSWFSSAASFLGMWVVMMVAMMLPSLVAMLWRYREAVGRSSLFRDCTRGIRCIQRAMGAFALRSRASAADPGARSARARRRCRKWF